MADTAEEKLQNMNIQDFDGSEFDPFAPQNKMASINNGQQPVDLLGECYENGQMTNGDDKHVSFDQEAGIGLPDPSYINQGQGECVGQKGEIPRHMSTGEILGYQNEYGESLMTGQVEYTGGSEEEDNNVVDIHVQDHSARGDYSSQDPSQNLHDQYVENDYLGDDSVQDDDRENFDGPVDYDNDEIDPDSWHPEMDPERLRRSQSPERSVSPYVHTESGGDMDSDVISSPSEMSHPGPMSEPIMSNIHREDPFIPKSEGAETPDLTSQGSQQISSEETESLDSRSECEGTPRRRRIPKPKTKKPLELPPWDDNVVIPKLPRMKPTLIGKQADLPPPSPPRLHRPRTAPARHNAKDASSDSGVEEEAKSPRKSSGDVKKKYGTDTKNERYRPGGGNIQVFSQKIDTRSVTPRTDTTKPRSALSPRISPSKDRAPSLPKAPTPNTKHVQSKIGSLNNVKHSPGGGNIKVLHAKVDFSNVQSKVGSKDKIDHKPKGGDKKIESQKLIWQTDSKIGSLKNMKHTPGGGNLKDNIGYVTGTMNTRENIHYQPGGGNVPEPYEEDLDWDADAKVNTLDNLDYEPGGGCVKIFSERLHWKAEPKVDTGLQRKSDKIQNDNIPVKSDLQRYDSSKQQVSITIEPVPERFNHSYLEPVPEVEYQSAADIKRDQTQIEPLRSQVVDSKVIKDPDIDQTDGVLDNTDTAKVIQQDWKQGPPPPPKPPRCIHEDWGHEKVDTSKSDEKEILTFTEEELEEILRKRDFVESQEDTNVSDNQSKQVEEQETEIKDDRNNFHIPINDITNENESEMESVDHKEDTVVLERMVIEKCDGKENVDISLNKSKKKSGFVNKMRCLFSNSKKKQAKENDKENRFSSTSYNINCSNSNRISVKGKKLKEFANEEQKEVELMVKYLGYHSPILSKKGKIIKEKDKESKKESCKNVLKKKHMEKGEPIEKLANLGYKSPKLAKKGGKPTIMTGSPTLKRKSGFGNKEMNVETMECITDENDRLDLLCCENVQMISVNEGVVSDYQDIDFGANVADIKNGRCVDGLTILNETKYVKMQEKSPVNGFVNEGYEYDDVASDEDTESPNEDDDTDESIEEERHTSVAEFTVNSNMKSQKGIQTTTFKYKMDKRPTSPLNIIKHEKISETCLSIDERTDVEKGVDQVFIAKKESAPTHDKFGYALVHKLENMKVSDDKNETENVLERNANNPENNRNRLGERNNFEKDVFDDIENKVMHKTVTKCERKSNLDQEEIEHELTLDEELRAVLANMHDNESSLLKTPRRHEGTETGSRPGTPKISVKPIWMQAEEERKGNGFGEKYGMRRYLSDDNLSKNTQPLFGRSNRTQSMMVRGGAVNMRSGNILRGSDRESARNLARYTKLIDLKSAPVDDVKKSPMEITSENERSLLSTKPTSGREMTGDFVSGLYDDAGNGSLEISKNNESLKFDSFERFRTSSGLCPGVFEGDSLGESVRTLNTISNTRGHSGHSNTHEDTVVSQKLSWSAKSRVGSLENATHSPGGGNVKILDQKIEIKAHSKVGSTANLKHKPGGGDKKIESQKLEFKETARSKVGSLDKVKHKPGGGDIVIHNEKLKWETTSKVKSLENADHVPTGGNVKIVDEKPVWTAAPKVESLVNADHVPGGGHVKILDEKVDFTNTAKPKVGSMDKVKHQPGGGDKKIETQKLNFKETAKARTDTGASTGERRSSLRSGSVTSSQDGSLVE